MRGQLIAKLAQTNTRPAQGCAWGAGPGLPQAGVQCPSWAIVARALDGVSLPWQRTAPLHATSVTLHKAAPAFPAIPFGDVRVRFLSCCSLGGDVADVADDSSFQ